MSSSTPNRPSGTALPVRQRRPPATANTATTTNPTSTQAPSGNPPSTTPRRRQLNTSSPRPLTRSSTQVGSQSTTPRRPLLRTNTTSSAMGNSASSSSRPAIPFRPNEEFHKYYVKLAKLVAGRKPEDKPRIVVFTDIEQDYDDLLAVIFLAEMHRMGAVELAGFVANHRPAEKRAKFLRTVLHLLNLPDVDVAVGSRGVPEPKKDPSETTTAPANVSAQPPPDPPTFYYELKNTTFESWKPEDPKKQAFKSGKELMESLVGSGRPPLTVLLISTLQDIGEFFARHEENPDYLRKNFRKYVSQGGYEVKQKPGEQLTMEPNMGMANNQFHRDGAFTYTNGLARHKLKSDAWSREAAKAARLPATFMKELFRYGPIGAHLEWLWMRQEFKFYWDPFNLPFLSHLTKGWYFNTRLGMDKDSEQYKKLVQLPEVPFSSAMPHIKVIAYDCCAAVGAVGDDFMRTMGILVPENQVPAYNTAEHGHRVFGRGVNDLGGIRAPALAKVMEAFLLGGLRATAPRASKIPDFQTLRHETVSSKLDVDLFLKLVPKLKEEAFHLEKARNCTEEAETKRKAGDVEGSKGLLIQAREKEKMAAICRAKMLETFPQAEKQLEHPPTREDVPYEKLYQTEMKKLQAANARR